MIVKAFGALSDRGQQLHLYGDLSADEAYVSELRQLVDRPGVYFHGSAPRDQVLELLRQADLVLVPTLWRETYSVIVDEAFQAGTPVLVSTQSAAAQRVIPEVNGLLAPAGDVAAWHTLLQRVCDEPALLGRLQQGITSPETVAQHTAAIEALYAEVLSVRRHEQPAKA